MPSACDTVKDAGNCLLMATHQLKQQPFSNKVRYNLVDSARNILEGTMKVLASVNLILTSVKCLFGNQFFEVLCNIIGIVSSFQIFQQCHSCIEILVLVIRGVKSFMTRMLVCQE